MNELKVFWLESADEILAIITNELEKDYPKDQLKSLNRKKYQVKRLGIGLIKSINGQIILEIIKLIPH